MLVSEILRKKSGSTITMNPHDGVETAIHMFKEKKIGAILVCELTGDLVQIGVWHFLRPIWGKKLGNHCVPYGNSRPYNDEPSRNPA